MVVHYRARVWSLVLLSVALVMLTSSLALSTPPASPDTESQSASDALKPTVQNSDIADRNVLVRVPHVVLLDTGNVKHEESYSDSQLHLIDSVGQSLQVIPALNKSQTIGGQHAVAIDRKRQRVYSCGGDGLTAVDWTGKVLWRFEQGSVSAVAIEPQSGNLWCEVGSYLNAIKTLVVDSEGKLVTEYPWGGTDIAYDPQQEVFWIAGYQILRFDRQGLLTVRRPLPDLPGIPNVPTVINARNWSAVSISPDQVSYIGNARHGGAWAAIRQHSDVTGSRNRLVRLDDKGETRMLVELGEVDPFAVACDARGNCWLVNREKSLLQYNCDGEQTGQFPISARAVIGDRDGAGAWVSTNEELIRLDGKGDQTWRYKLGYRTEQTWLGTLGY